MTTIRNTKILRRSNMIYTVTFNPSLDYIVDVTDFKTGVVNRTTGEKILQVVRALMFPWFLRILE